MNVGQDAQVYSADFGLLGFATCFDVNLPEVWKRLADQGAEVVIWPSAYSAGTSLQTHAINHHFYIVSVTQKTGSGLWKLWIGWSTLGIGFG
jgi:predicted amidohydrolase